MLRDNGVSAVSIMVANATNKLFEVYNLLINSLVSHANIWHLEPIAHVILKDITMMGMDGEMSVKGELQKIK
jgi:hypothetical protein